eukprot:TRINITY_DN49637_c0_g1_i1.p1 TRINITY_DN49637_c0_g1~~TRINITY_DN49637_c0_g1_i1.p1  ORF type:complete len:211 (-),score=49.27 TRINITY_DN49637_c0_g1_i1:141-773(-)
MSKRKGLSFDDKKATLLAAMHAEGSFYTLKELENLGKSKGVIPQAVKDVVEGLCADGTVHNDKVGSQQIFWALPSQKISALQAKKSRLIAEVERMQKEHDELRAASDEAAKDNGGSVPSEQEVAELKARVAVDQRRCAEMRAQIDAFERCGPAKLLEMKSQTAMAIEAANRWADNICSVRSMFVRERRGEVTTAQFNRTFELPEDFEYLE